MHDPQAIYPHPTPAHPARPTHQRVYGQPRNPPSAQLPSQQHLSPSKQHLPSFPVLSAGPLGNVSLDEHDDSTGLPQRKTIQEQLAEIDAMPDADLARLVPPPSAQQSGLEPGPSSEPSVALPTSLAHSVASSRLHDSPPSSMPRTPLDISPFAPRRPKRLRVSDSDSEVDADLDAPRGLPKRVQTCASDDDSLPSLEQALADEHALALAEARSALALEPVTQSHKQPAPVIHSDISDADSEPTPKPKSKRPKGLSKKDKEETQRTIALCQRQRPAKLIGSCRAPNSRLDDIVLKATAATSAQQSSAASRAAPVPRSTAGNKASNLTVLALDVHQSARSASDSLTSPIDEFPPVADEALSNDDDELLPDLAELLAAPLPRADAQAAKKHAWLAQLRQTRAQDPSPSRAGGSDSDDADLDIVGHPKPMRLVHPSPKDILAARSMARRVTKRPSLPMKALFGTADERVKPDGLHPKKDVMKGLLQRSAVEGALLREQKRAEFVERGGKLAREMASRAAPDSVDLKAILKKSEEEEGIDPEDAVDCDWDEEIELSGDEDDEDEEMGEEGSSSMDDEEPAGEEGSSATEELESAAAEPPQAGDDESGIALVASTTSSNKSSTSSVFTDMPCPGQSVRKCLAPATSPTPDSPISDWPRPDGVLVSQTAPSSPIDLPGFNLNVEPPRRKSVTATAEDLDEDLPGFGPASNSAGFSGSLAGLSQFEGSGCSDKQASQAGFSQFFGDDDRFQFTHPPPALKQAESARDVEDEDAELAGSCVLPAVHVLPEERERDMVMMMLGVQQRSMEEEEHEPTQYVNHRGLLTQHKPSLDANMLPESPLMSQDLMARTPFALRKDHLPDPSCEDEQADGEAHSPCGGHDFDVSGSPSARDRMQGTKPVKDAFAVVMEGRRDRKETRGRGAGRLFLADQADESDDELGGGLGRQAEEEDDSGSEAGLAELADLVNDGADDRDEATRLAGDEAVEALALQHQQEAEARQADHIARLVAGKVRIKQARRGRGDGGISDSDSEDDEEEEWVKANKRAQEFAAKKKKMAIHRLAEKHASFFKSYEEGTSQWVDEDDLACLQPEEPKASGGESEDDEDDDYEEEVMFERTSRHRSSYSGVRPREKVAGDEGEEFEEAEGPGGSVARAIVLSSSPVKLPPLKISDPTLKRAGGMGGPSKSAHADLERMYNWKQAAELTERQKQGVAELVGEERAGERRGAGKSSSITYQNQEQQRAQKKAKEMELRGAAEGNGSKGKGRSGGGVSGGGMSRLAKLKGSKK